MGNAFSRYIRCIDTEIIEYSRKGGFGSDDNIKLVDHLDRPEIDIEFSSEPKFSIT